MRISAIKPNIGGRVELDREALGDPQTIRHCLSALEQYGVLVFPRLGLSGAEQLAFTKRLNAQGTIGNLFPGGAAMEGEVFEIAFDPNDKRRSDYVKVSFFWHIDGLVAEGPLPKAALLTARKVAEKGGQTEFASTYAAYEALPDDEKAEIAELAAIHSPAAGFRFVLDAPTEAERAQWATHAYERQHPLVWTHEDGRKSLIVGITADRIAGMPVADGRALLARLTEWAAQSEFKYRHQWQDGDLVIWNNHGVMHRVIPYGADSGRSMQRTSINVAREAAA